jgi:hypothetical protein
VDLNRQSIPEEGREVTKVPSPGLYRCNDGTLYEVIGTAKMDSRLLVVCKSQREPYELIAVELASFEAKVQVKGRMVNRFTLLWSFK